MNLLLRQKRCADAGKKRENQMRRIMLDTNVYGMIAVDERRCRILEAIGDSKEIIVYGSKVIRDEIRAIPKGKARGENNFRMDMLNLFDSLVKGRVYPCDKSIEGIQEKYFAVYRELGGNKSQKEMRNDFCIIDTASKHNLYIAVSQDNATMFSELAVKSYRTVNIVLGLRTPEFIGYEELNKDIRRWTS